MGKTRTANDISDLPSIRPALTPENRENQIINEAMNAVEERIRNRTASSAEYVHFLRLASTKTQLEKEKLELEKQLLEQKTETLKSQRKTEELYAAALRAMNIYSGKATDEDYDDDEDI